LKSRGSKLTNWPQWINMEFGHKLFEMIFTIICEQIYRKMLEVALVRICCDNVHCLNITMLQSRSSDIHLYCKGQRSLVPAKCLNYRWGKTLIGLQVLFFLINSESHWMCVTVLENSVKSSLKKIIPYIVIILYIRYDFFYTITPPNVGSWDCPIFFRY
jgi:hypothetical protein